jgi:4,5-dihydroxyphthalate decarboxylase
VREANYPELFPNADELEGAWYRKTGIYSIHGTIVVKDEILKEHPWVARSLFDDFSRAKAEWLARLHSGQADSATDRNTASSRRLLATTRCPTERVPVLRRWKRWPIPHSNRSSRTAA